jgi:hypothetical protein
MTQSIQETVAAHEIIDHLIEVYGVGSHPQRKGESPEFNDSVKRLQTDGHYKCFICGCVDNLQTHHWLSEWSLADEVDFAKVQRLAQIFDVYGYARLLVNIPITSVDDVRNCMVLCQNHHIAQVTGIHSTTFSAWVSQCLAKDGVCIVPQDRAAIEKLIDAKQAKMQAQISTPSDDGSQG